MRKNPEVIIRRPARHPELALTGRPLHAQQAGLAQDGKAARSGRIYIASGNSLLQAFTHPGRTIRDVRRSFLN